jgi:asparagine synthase (glutamine-hydrolysing)
VRRSSLPAGASALTSDGQSELMCGIAGFAGDTGDPRLADSRLRTMCGAIRHRGPDDEGRYVAPGIAIGMRRLSIIDVAGGHQPLTNEHGSVIVVFNGEIYNHQALRSDLQHRGHAFRTKSDTETLVHLYEDEGEQMVHRLRGMFAFAIWDTTRQRLFVARDRIGIKPLYYWRHDGGLAFGSELRTFLSLPDFPRDLSAQAIAEFLAFGYVPEQSCIFSAARKLPPGHTLTWDREHGVRTSRYWTPVRDELPPTSDDELVEELRRLLDDAVRSHLESDVPLGAFLSGGIDSSAVVAHMARAMSRPVETFSIGFEEAAFNEAPHAATVARDLRTRHTELIVRPDADALVDDVVAAFDEPFADASALPTFLVAQLARQNVTVALSGDGGDELFAGYTRYATVMGERGVPGAPLRATVRGLASLLPHATFGRNRLLNIARTQRGRYASTIAFPLSQREGGVATDELAQLVPPLDSLLAPWFDQASGRDFATQMTLVDMMTYLPGDILTKVDRTSMAVSLEARVPLLDHTLIEFASALPSSVKLRDGTGKWLLRRAVDGIVPPQVLTKRKQGFGVPLVDWFRGPLRHRLDSLASDNSRIAQFVSASAVRRLVNEHLTSRRNHMGRLWRLVALERWLDALSRGVLERPSMPGDALHSIVKRAASSA